MISRTRMKLDVFGQSILIGAIILLWLFNRQLIWTNLMLFLLGVWQLASAVHLFFTYKYIQRINFLRTAIILAISLPVWIHMIGNWAYLPVVGVLLWYFFWSLRDMFIVYRRPRSFWDL